MKKTRIFILTAILLISGTVAYCYYDLYAKEVNLITEQADYTVTSEQITKEFLKRPQFAHRKYWSKVVVVQGTVSEIHGPQIIVDQNIICMLKTPNPRIRRNQLIVVKGRVSGYDDFMKELKLESCFKI